MGDPQGPGRDKPVRSFTGVDLLTNMYTLSRDSDHDIGLVVSRSMPVKLSLVPVG